MLFFQNMFLPLYNNKKHVCTSISVQYLKRKVCMAQPTNPVGRVYGR